MLADAHSFSYIASDVPEDMTLDAWRRRHVAAARARHTGRLEWLRRRRVAAPVARRRRTAAA